MTNNEPGAAPNSEYILVVEDNRDMRAFVREVLQEHGYRVSEAYSGWKALHLAEDSQPDVLLLDWQLPDITGLDVLRALRAGGCLSPAILMTGYGSEELAIIALRLGVHNYLRKPFSAQELVEAIESALALSRLRREREKLTKSLADADRQLAQANRQLAGCSEQVEHLKAPLNRLALISEELKHGRVENWMTRVQEMQDAIVRLAQMVENLKTDLDPGDQKQDADDGR